MKIAVTSTGKDMDARIDQRFGRCAYFLLVDSDNLQVDAYENENAAAQSGAGIQAARFVADKGAQVVLTGRCGPKALQSLSAAGIRLIEGQAGIVKDAVHQFVAGGRATSAPATSPGADARVYRPDSGQRPGSPGRRGMGMGRCKGAGGGNRSGGMGGSGMGRPQR